jgi:hypothetical protein
MAAAASNSELASNFGMKPTQVWRLGYVVFQIGIKNLNKLAAEGEGVPLPKKTNDLGRLTYLKSTIDTNRVLPKVANPDDVLAQSRVQKFAADPSWKPLPQRASVTHARSIDASWVGGVR